MTEHLENQQSENVLRPQATFFGAEVGDLADIGSDKVACCGIFCDHLGSGEPGGRFFARQLRYCSSDAWTRNALSIDADNIVDVGDLNVYPLEPVRLGDVLRDQIGQIVRTGARPFIASGGYGLSPAIVAGLSDAIGSRNLDVIRVSRFRDRDDADPDGPLVVPRSQASSRIVHVLSGREQSLHWFPSSKAVKLDKGAASDIGQCFLSVDADILNPIYGDTGCYGGLGGDRPDDIKGLADQLRGRQIVGVEMTGHLPSFELHGRAVTNFTVAVCASLVDMLRGERQ
jgi:hypothetical protein